ncbi:hypothetical protein GOBAR_AA11591 [Gossypium barbadense]|uniref:Fungal lipase-type domain-containing protein n=1 Tax=Gossypium barbadense TaxID=3634 RepID=A0A2P5Y0E7_GOSBA|nr:hypothetical protein GOBAR_AA11591 [Gossypium barbadense]
MAVNKYQADHYLMLKPNEVSIRKVIRLLWSKRMEENDYFYLRESDEKEVFIEKGLAIASLAAQKGKVKIPKRESDDFMSFAAYIDKRVKLDEKIEPGNVRYNSALAIMAAKLAYENKGFIRNTVEQHWKMEFIDMDTNYWNDYFENFHTQGFMFYDERVNMIVVSFRGTEAFNAYDWCTDFDISCFENPEMGKIHGGFMKALGLVMDHGWPPQLPADKRNKNLAYYAIRDELNERMDLNKETKFIVTGHSLGGALAVLFPAILALHGETKLLERLEGIYTFGQPRVGDGKFKRLPFDDPVTSLYTHFGTCLYFNSCYKGQILDEEPHKNYFATFGGTRRFLNALFELVRCLYLPLLKGGDYREGLAMILIVRFTALAFPAVADHNPLDYVNATRLGSMEVFQRAESSKKWLKNSATSGREVQDKIKYC